MDGGALPPQDLPDVERLPLTDPADNAQDQRSNIKLEPVNRHMRGQAPLKRGQPAT
jgi:hypothetical protein